MLKTTDLKRWRDALLKLRDRLEIDAAQILAEATHTVGREDAGGLPDIPSDSADAGSQESEDAVTVGMAENEAILLSEVEGALDRIREGRFGECELCRKPISKARLTALPYARLCVKCMDTK